MPRAETNSATTRGPRTMPITPKNCIPPKTLKKMSRSGILTRPLMMIGRRKLSTKLIPNMPMRRGRYR